MHITDAIAAVYMSLVLIALGHPDPYLRARALRLLTLMLGPR